MSRSAVEPSSIVRWSGEPYDEVPRVSEVSPACGPSPISIPCSRAHRRSVSASGTIALAPLTMPSKTSPVLPLIVIRLGANL
jgi:hypothetical protein